jgi:sec-independent protein translocase protein TatB
MFDIGWTKLVLIAVVALIAIGPKELPGVLRNVGHWVGKIRRLAAEFQSQFQEAMREAEMDLKKHADDLNNAARLLTEQPNSADSLAAAQTDEAASLVTGVSEAPAAAEEAVPTAGVDAPGDQPQVTRA